LETQHPIKLVVAARSLRVDKLFSHRGTYMVLKCGDSRWFEWLTHQDLHQGRANSAAPRIQPKVKKGSVNGSMSTWGPAVYQP